MKRAAALAVAAMLSACGNGPPRTELHVFAASSLTEVLGELGRTFERAREGVDVVFNFAASSALARQIEEGAAADVFASADTVSMERLAELAPSPSVFARNRLAIAVQDGNPRRIGALGDLARDELVVVLCAEQVPCGTYAGRVLRRAGVTLRAASREENVKAVLTKVSLGEADAGIVYVTDTADGVDLVPIPASTNVRTAYPVAVLRDAAEPALGRAFVALLRSGDGRRALRDRGFDA